MYEYDICASIYAAVGNIITTSSDLSYFKTRQMGFRPVGESLTNPTMYPWLFMEYKTTTQPRNPRTGRWEYEFIISIVAMTLADKGNFEDIVYNIGSGNINKGIGTIMYDLKKLFWSYHKGGLLGIPEIQDFSIGETHQPTVLSVQRLLFSEYVRGLEMDLQFRIWETEDLP
jgi:hypothetical protein